MAKALTKKEWDAIEAALDENPEKYGFPKRVYGSYVLGSFNIRKLGYYKKRDSETWKFLARVCRNFDILAVQEIMDDLSGVKKLLEEMGEGFGLILSDTTGAFPGKKGLPERLGFIYNWQIVKRTEIATDITYDRSEVLKILGQNIDGFYGVFKRTEKYNAELEEFRKGLSTKKPKKPSKKELRMPAFLSFIRQPFCVSFRINGYPGTKPYEFMAVNAHLNFGDPKHDPKQEFYALMDWITERANMKGKTYYPNFVLLGDMNLDFDNPKKDKARMEEDLKSLNKVTAKGVSVNFPFLDIHPKEKSVFRSNARESQTYDQIGLFIRDKRLPDYKENANMGKNPTGPDYGVFNFVKLFSDALDISKSQKKNFIKRFEHKVSDHMPIWLRLPLPGN